MQILLNISMLLLLVASCSNGINPFHLSTRDGGDDETVKNKSGSDRPTDNGEGVPGYLTDHTKVQFKIEDDKLTIEAPPATITNGDGKTAEGVIVYVFQSPKVEGFDELLKSGDHSYLLRLLVRKQVESNGSIAVDIPNWNPGTQITLIVGNETNLPGIATVGASDLVAVTKLERNHFATYNDLGDSQSYISLTTAEHHACTIDSNGDAFCWGRGDIGGLGNNADVDNSKAVAVSNEDLVADGLTGKFVEVETGGFHTCALALEGTLWCWGYDAGGALGDGDETGKCGTQDCRKKPTKVVVESEQVEIFDQLELAFTMSCARSVGREVYCWGSQYIADLKVEGRSTFAALAGFNSIEGYVKDFAITESTAMCTLQSTDKLFCWGSAQWAQLGNGDIGANSSCPSNGQPCQTEPVEIDLGEVVPVAVTAGENQFCVHGSQNETLCWGSNIHNKLGVATKNMVKIGVPTSADHTSVNDEKYVRVAPGEGFSCAITDKNNVACFGANDFGQLALDPATTTNDCGKNCEKTPTFTPLVGDSSNPITLLSSGKAFACATKQNPGKVVCWGANDRGQLGAASTEAFSFTPLEVTFP